jgi:hypothetical protein
MCARLLPSRASRVTCHAFLLFLWLFAGLVAAQDAEELELDHSLSTEFETPHVTWAKPYALGTLRVLFFCNGRGTVPREAVELQQRFDFDIDAIFWRRIVDTTKEGWHGGDLGLRRMLRLAAKPYDCYVFFGIRPNQLTAEMQVKCLQPVIEGGKGVVLVGVDDKRVLKPARRMGAPPQFVAQARPEAVHQVGKGRGVRLPARPDIPYDFGWQLLYEQWQERLGRAIVWAAGREPEVELAASVNWTNPEKRPLIFERTVHHADGTATPLKTLKSSAAEGTCPRTEGLDALGVGVHQVSAIVRSKRGTEAWLLRPLTVETAPAFQIAELSLTRAWGEAGERVQGSVRMANPRAAEDKARVVIRLRDRRDRILARQAITNWNAGTFDLPIPAWAPMLLCVEAAALDAEGVVHGRAYEYFNVVKRHREQFNFLIWDVPKGPTAPWGEASLARLGTTLQLGHGNPPRVLAAYDIAWVPYTTRILEKHDKQGLMRPHCWNDADAVQDYVTRLAEKHRESRRHGVYVYSLGDENDVRGSCLSPHCLAAYRRYLEQIYGTVAKLNASWGSDYGGFDEVELLKSDDNEAAEAKRQGNTARWYDRQAFRSWNYVQYCKRFAAAYKRIDAKALTGFEGAGRFERGDDIDLFVRELGFWSPYPGTADEVLRSIAPQGFPRANWMGYRKDAPPLIAKYWRMVTRGYPSVWWWRWDCIGRFHGFLAPHLGPWPATRELVEDTQIVRDGLGRLLMRSEMQGSGIAVLFSHPSIYANKVEHGTRYGSYTANHVEWHRGIRDLGLNFRYVTDRQLRLGEFDAARTKALILAQAEAIGEREAAAIRQFVRDGGRLVADVRPGIYTGRCKPREAGVLDDLFGIRRTGVGAAKKGQAVIDTDGGPVAFDDALCDPHVQLADGSASGRCGDTPIMIASGMGQGETLLLNFAMSSYPRMDLADTPEAAAELFLGLAAEAGIVPPVRTFTDGRRTRNLETARWRNGTLDIVALFRHTGEDEDVEVRLGRPMHVRDLRFRRSFPNVEAFPTRILGGRPTWLVLSPEPLATLQAKLSQEAVAPGERPTLRLSVPDAQGLHAVRIRAKAPGGEPAEWLHQMVLVGAKAVDVPLPIAFNDPAGEWSIEAIDLFTEEPVSVPLTVQEAAR